MEAAIGLAQDHGNEVTLSYRKEKLVRIKQKNEERFEKLVAKGTVRLAMSTDVTEILPRAVRLKGEGGVTEIPNDFVFVFAGGEPPLGLLTKIGVRLGGPAAATA